MCGISGEIILGSGRVVPADAIAMLRSLMHRGPDGWGYYSDAARRVMLLHNRLAIIDLPGGAQPLCNESGTVWVAVNGEFYDYEAIADDLRKRGHRFRSRCDTEIAVHLYEERGLDFVHDLRGEFAVSLYDEQKERLVLARDRFGIKPLFYTQTPQSLIFGSEAKAILSHHRVRRDFDRGALARYLCGLPNSRRSIFRGIRALPPGGMLTAEDGRITHTQYWDLDFLLDASASHPAMPTIDEAAEGLREHLHEAVRLRLQSDVGTGVYLSGGIDSTVVANLMRQAGQESFTAYTVGFESADHDESRVTRATAAALELPLEEVRVAPGELSGSFIDSLWHAELPVPNTHGTAKFLLSRLASAGDKVILNGQGADEILAGYELFPHQVLLEKLRIDPQDGDARRAIKAMTQRQGVLGYMSGVHRYPNYDRVVRALGAYPYPAIRARRLHRIFRRLLSPPMARALSPSDPLEYLAAMIDTSRLRGRSNISATQYALMKTDLPVYILNVLGDREEMAHGIEGRLPFLDHKLAEYCMRLPSHLLATPGHGKHLLRVAARDLVGAQNAARPKHVFLAPTIETLGYDGFRELADSFLSTDMTERVGLFRPSAVRSLRRAVRLCPRRSVLYSACEAAIALMLSTHILHDLFLDRFPEACQRYIRPGPLSDSLNRLAETETGDGERTRITYRDP